MDEFETLLEAQRVSVERFVRFRLNSKADADDVLQEVYLTACQKFSQLKNKDSFKAWIVVTLQHSEMTETFAITSLSLTAMNLC
ncbi:MAG: hypothetical protein DBY04_01625 [Clostridiales bacterium]|nr:MAG: hypothetical protein DBY04_01625 [Clostridiales bacterium]